MAIETGEEFTKKTGIPVTVEAPEDGPVKFAQAEQCQEFAFSGGPCRPHCSSIPWPPVAQVMSPAGVG